MKEDYSIDVQDNKNEEIIINNVEINQQEEVITNVDTNNPEEKTFNNIETSIDDLEKKLEMRHAKFVLILGIIFVALSVIVIIWAVGSTTKSFNNYQNQDYTQSIVGPISLFFDLFKVAFSIPFSIGILVSIWATYYGAIKFHDYFIRLNKKQKITTALIIIAVIIFLIAVPFIKLLIYWYI